MHNLNNIVILTGAEISAESGLETFRSEDRTWNKFRIEDVATPQAFQKNPTRVYDFYNKRRQDVQKAKPNAAHHALYKLEQNWPRNFLLITQNVDDLHERAGSKHLVHMHGTIKIALCLFCGQRHHWCEDMDLTSICPSCTKTKMLRPDIVWFGEIPYHMDIIENALYQCDLFVSIGTSVTVYPAANFVSMAKANGAKSIDMNLMSDTNQNCTHRYNSLFNQSIIGSASQSVPKFVCNLLQKNAFGFKAIAIKCSLN
ncbi:NAD-dependent deacylase [Bartonella tamiae]|uniref:protein acetyllysine N-acetyltransferase n=1 Tax=Bartonella tamiae Th239 TaxID=1094558 RepID=J0ZSF9_9HYPH|nr:NAD-dependent deacylase [Bartonella tamiae]EJF91703.1 hypothetical protein ME5_00082 [Bartonella tamiae Th239]EJF92630.1 hypothetical protein MEG_01800 [Bartonella tamiae Th307]